MSSFQGPNHAKALFWGLFATWLFVASVVWYCIATARPIDLMSLGQGAMGLSLLSYGSVVVHRTFLLNGVPFLAAVFDVLATTPRGVEVWLQVLGALVLLVSCLVLLWVVYHARRDVIDWGRSVPIAAVLLAMPILLYEAGHRLLGVDLYEMIVAAILKSPHG